MRKVIAAINMTLDGFCDHTAGIADDALHDHYTRLLQNAGLVLYGRKTFELMQYWQTLMENPTGNPALDNFARIMDRVPKLVFSHTLNHTGWHSATLATKTPQEEIRELRQQKGNDIFIGSPGLIAALTNQGLVDEYQLCIHPVIAGNGLPLFKHLQAQIVLQLLKTQTLGGGHIILYYTKAGK